jgi:putative ABC transport system ATP-binding protein
MVTHKMGSGLIIKAEKLSRIYVMDIADVVGIANIDLNIVAGETVVLKGESGSGKSTLLSLIASLDKPTGGKINVAGFNIQYLPEDQLTRFRREVVGMVFQNFNLLPTLNVKENVMLPGLLAGRDNLSIKKKADKLLQWLGLSIRSNHFPAQLSGGEMQRTAIARALINDPAIVLADEPTGNLDSRNSQIVMDLFQEITKEDKRTLIIATHSNIADHIATTHLYLKDGHFDHDNVRKLGKQP